MRAATSRSLGAILKTLTGNESAPYRNKMSRGGGCVKTLETGEPADRQRSMSKRDRCAKTTKTGEPADRHAPCRNVTVVLRHSRLVNRLTVNLHVGT